MEERFKDFGYKPVSFGQLDSLFTAYKDTEEGKKLFELASYDGEYAKKAREWSDKAVFASWGDYNKYYDSADFYRNKRAEAEKLFEKNDVAYMGEFCGWIMEHEYSGKNYFGVAVTEKESFYFNKELTSIVEKPFGERRKPEINKQIVPSETATEAPSISEEIEKDDTDEEYEEEYEYEGYEGYEGYEEEEEEYEDENGEIQIRIKN
jgi:hypothetical protein